VTGLNKRPAQITMEQLAIQFEAMELPVMLVCAGNRRKEQNMVRQSAGFNWGPGAVSTSVWRVARLRDVLRRCGVMGEDAGADNVCFEGAEDLAGGAGASTAPASGAPSPWTRPAMSSSPTCRTASRLRRTTASPCASSYRD
jgi:DMSO/TMAO reductase YedYZ molybdopterin-dependent catalytic subunit